MSYRVAPELLEDAAKRCADMMPKEQIPEFLRICADFRAYPASFFPEFVYQLRERLHAGKETSGPKTEEAD